jgi:hypothetical protein
MSETANPTATFTTSQDQSERLQLANRLYGEFHTQCFWHSPRDLVITEELVPFVVKGLRTHGGRRGYMLADKLQDKNATAGTADQESR